MHDFSSYSCACVSACFVNYGRFDERRVYYVNCPCDTGLTCKGNGIFDMPLGEMGRLCVCVCVDVCLCVHAYVCLCVCVVCVCVRMFVCVYVSCVCVRMFVCVYVLCVLCCVVCVCVCVCVFMMPLCCRNLFLEEGKKKSSVSALLTVVSELQNCI